MSDNADITIRLTRAQIAQVVRDASGDTLQHYLTALPDVQTLVRSTTQTLKGTEYSRAAFRALLVLAAIPADRERNLSDIAQELKLPASTTHRYLNTWSSIGLLEHDPRSRTYRRVTSPPLAANDDRAL